jgi:hypothetical protein
LNYFKEHNGYVLSRDLNSYFGCCTTERTDALSTVLSHLQYETKEIRHVSASALGLVGSNHPKAQKQQRLIFKEMPPGKIHLIEDNVMIHDSGGRLLYEYATTEDPDEVTCGLCLNILKARDRKSK